MNTGQFQKYHVNRKKWEEARAARGLPFDEAALNALKQKQIGRVCSSKAFLDRDLDKMIAGFAAEIAPGDFNAQMAQQDQPEKRHAILVQRIFAAGEIFISGENKKHREFRTIDYCRGIWRNLGFDKNGAAWAWPIVDFDQLRKVMGVIEAQAARVQATRAKEEERLAAVPADAADEEIAG